MTKTVYTMGYSGRKLPEVQKLVADLGAVLLDIRYSPRSRAPTWNRSSLQSAFGSRYRHVRELGNVNYKGGPIKLVDLEAGIQQIEKMGRPVILFCVCKDPAVCHRTTIANVLRVRGFDVQELESPGLSRYKQKPMF